MKVTKLLELKVREITIQVLLHCRPFVLIGRTEWQLPGYGRETSTNHASLSMPGTCQPRGDVSRSPKGSDSKSPQKINVHGGYLSAGTGPVVRGSSPANRGASRGTYRSRGRGGYMGRANATMSRQTSRLFKDSTAKSKWRSGSEPNGGWS